MEEHMLQESKKARLIMLAVGGAVLIALFALYFFVRPAVIQAKPVNHSGIIRFELEREWKNGDSLKLTMRAANRRTHIVIYDSTLGGKRENDADENLLASLEQLIEEKNIYLWDGFYDRLPSVSGKDSFSLTIEYTDGNVVAASGVCAFPNDFDDGFSALRVFFSNALFDAGNADAATAAP